MTKRTKNLSLAFMSLILAFICAFIYCTDNYRITKASAEAITRNIEVSQKEIDYQSIFDEFEDGKLETVNNITTFEGIKTFDLADFEELDLVADSETGETPKLQVKYNYAYDSETNIITLTANLIGDDSEPLIDTLTGMAFVNEQGELDAVFDCDDGEYVLLSELKDAGMIENCGWFKNAWKKVKNAVKKVTNTVVGKVGAVLTVAVPVVIGVIAGIAAAPVLPIIATGALVGAGIAAGTAAISTYQQDGKVDWETVGICAGVGTAVGALSSFLGYKAGQLIRSMFPKANPSKNVNSFDTYSGFKKHYGKASDYIKDGEWHHIVEQQTVTKGINAGSTVYNSQNTVAISKNLHHKISGYYSRIYQDGMTFRQYVNTLSYEQQYTKGLEILKMFADQLGETIIWL